jgi:hypothetical protein
MVVESLDARGHVTAFGSGVVIAHSVDVQYLTLPHAAMKPRRSGRVITNRHVIEDGASFKIKHGALEWPAQLIRVDGDHDLAELSVAGLDAAPVDVRESSALVVGEKVYAIGAPEGLELTISEGLISGLREFDKGQVIQTSAAISHGSSGGGLFDSEGRLVGITTFYLKEGQSLNFALPAQWTLALDRQPVNTGLASKESSRRFQALAWSEVGRKAYLSGDYKTALRAGQEAVRLDPGYWAHWYNMGDVYILLGDYEKALDALQEALRLKPSTLPPHLSAAGEEHIWMDLGTTYMDVNDFEKALDAYQRAVRLAPDNAYAWEGLGHIRCPQGIREGAHGPTRSHSPET